MAPTVQKEKRYLPVELKYKKIRTRSPVIYRGRKMLKGEKKDRPGFIVNWEKYRDEY